MRPDTTIESLESLNPSFKELGEGGVDKIQLKYFPELDKITHIHTAGNSPAMSDAASITLLSKSKNSAIEGRRLQGKVIMTLLNGEIVFKS